MLKYTHIYAEKIKKILQYPDDLNFYNYNSYSYEFLLMFSECKSIEFDLVVNDVD